MSVTGMCYPASEALYHLLGGKDAGLTPMRIVHEGVPHWYLRWESDGETYYIDPTSTQFETAVPYAEGRGCGFLTKTQSARARSISKRAFDARRASIRRMIEAA